MRKCWDCPLVGRIMADNADIDAELPDPFAPLNENSPTADAIDVGVDNGEQEVWEPQLPSPSEPGDASSIVHWKLGVAAARWVYRSARGAPLFAAVRFDLPDGSKQILPFTYGRREWTTKSGTRRNVEGWHFKRPTKPVPLYGLDNLASQPRARLLISEGEKTADAAAQRFTDVVSLTWQGGGAAVGNADWSCLAGRSVTIWPDNDKPGRAAADHVARLALAAGAVEVRIVAVPATWREKWDLADGLPGGVTTQTLIELMESAPCALAAELPKDFSLEPTGIWFQPAGKKGDKSAPQPVWVCAPFDIVAETADEHGENWGLMLRWRDRDGRQHERSISRRLLHTDGSQIAADLEQAGLAIGTSKYQHDLLKELLSQIRTPHRKRSVTRSGWHQTESGYIYMLPDGAAFGADPTNLVLQTERVAAAATRPTKGTLEEWQQNVARFAIGNDRVGFYLSAAFTGPLLDVMGEPSGGLHLHGGSQTGKTITLRCAASVWGCPDTGGEIRTWRATSHGMEGVAAETCDALLPLDEIGMAPAHEVGEIVYSLANETGKARAARDGSARARRTWRVMFLSTGEVPLAVKMGERGGSPMAGQEVRLANIPADAGAGLGLFQVLHGMEDGAMLAHHLKKATMMYYGTAVRAFLTKLAEERAFHPDELAALITESRQFFLNRNLPDGADGQVISVARRFALIAVSGELARTFGVLPWPEGEASRAAASCFVAWLEGRGGKGPAEDAQAISTVRRFIEMHGEARFTLLEQLNARFLEHETIASRPTINRVGFRRLTATGREFLIYPESWKTEACGGLDPQRAAAALDGAGFLDKGKGSNWAKKHRIPGFKTGRFYTVKGTILGDTGE